MENVRDGVSARKRKENVIQCNANEKGVSSSIIPHTPHHLNKTKPSQAKATKAENQKTHLLM